ncbi:MAG: YbhB/YbcL family Raf kinase inhibitor-like protein [Acidobacteriota bacterium]
MMRQAWFWMAAGAALWAVVAFAAQTGKLPARLTVTSPDFTNGGTIPRKCTCAGEDLSPALTWSGLSPEARAIVVICDDPDAPGGTWVHWVLYDLPATERGLPAGVLPHSPLPGGALQGMNSWNKPGYGGPCRPPGKPHRYFFKVYALDAPLALGPGASKTQVLAAMRDHVLAMGELMGTFGR